MLSKPCALGEQEVVFDQNLQHRINRKFRSSIVIFHCCMFPHVVDNLVLVEQLQRTYRDCRIFPREEVLITLRKRNVYRF